VDIIIDYQAYYGSVTSYFFGIADYMFLSTLWRLALAFIF